MGPFDQDYFVTFGNFKFAEKPKIAIRNLYNLFLI